jgi:hypothetical protein
VVREIISPDILFKEKYIRPIFYQRFFTIEYSGKDWTNFEPETLWFDLRTNYNITEIPEHVRNKVNAIKTFETTNRFYDDVVGFEKMILAFNDNYIDTTMWQICPPNELCLGIIYTQELDNAKSKEYNKDIIAYVRGACEEWGLVFYPKTLSVFQPEFSEDSLPSKIIKDLKNHFKTKEAIKIKASEWQLTLLNEIETYIEQRMKISEGAKDAGIGK